MKKNEPLKGKVVPFIGDKQTKIIWLEDVESAVQGLLEEVDKLDRIELEEFADEQFDNLHDPDEVIVHAIDYFKSLIREWFPDVWLEKNEKKN